MARQKRLNIPGAIYHVITRGLNGMSIFQDDKDRFQFLERLSTVLMKTDCLCYSWALMNNHIHLLLRPTKISLSDTMRKLLTGYAIAYNRRHKRHGYLYQNRYKSILCQEDTYFLELIRYIHLNPVRAGIIKNIKELDDYPWTGHGIITGKMKNRLQQRNEVLKHFDKSEANAIKMYQGFIEDGWYQGKQVVLSSGGLRRNDRGWGSVKEKLLTTIPWRGDERILGDGEFVNNILKIADEEMERKENLLGQGWTLDELANRVCSMLGISTEALNKRGRLNSISYAKGLIAYWGIRQLGLNGNDIVKYLNMKRPSLNNMIELGEKFVKKKSLKLIN